MLVKESDSSSCLLITSYKIRLILDITYPNNPHAIIETIIMYNFSYIETGRRSPYPMVDIVMHTK